MMKRITIIGGWLLLLFILGACHSEVQETDTPDLPIMENSQTEVKVKIDLPEVLKDKENLTINSLTDAQPLGEETTLTSNYNDLPQIFYVTDSEDNIILMSKACISTQKSVSLGVESTALALAGLNPLFANSTSEGYEKIQDLLQSRPSFPKLVTEVENVIGEGVDLFDKDNTLLFVELSNVWDEMWDDIDLRSSENIGIFTRANTITGINPDPVLVETDGVDVIIRNKGLVPTYECQVYHGGRYKESRLIKTHDSYGMLDIFETVGNVEFGKPETFSLIEVGEYKFFLDRTTEDAIHDFSMRLWSDVISMFGLYNCGAILENSATAIATIAPLLMNRDTDFRDVLKAVSGAVYSIGLSALRPEQLGNLMSRVCVVYNVIKGFTNEMIRCYLGLTAPHFIDFCLCSYDGEVTSCTHTDLEKVSGDGQVGFAGQRLMLPLTVSATVFADDGTEVERSTYQKIKFEVIKGGGSVEQTIVGTESDSKLASTYWILGEEGEQEVKAVVVDMVTGVEISDPVYFTASLREEADLTIRLDWNKLSGNTDIDLHVTDPFGEEIAYYHMQSASGGWLDRDDVVGPGPEHVCWTKAPAGAYLVQVHYYGSDDKLVTNYSVSINCNKQNYGPFTGSIGYHQLVTIGVINLPSGEFTRSDGTSPLEIKEWVKDNVVYPYLK